MGSPRFSSSTKNMHPKIENEMRMVITFFDQQNPVGKHTVLDGQTVNANWYVEILKRFKWPHYCNGQWNSQNNVHTHIVATL